MMQSNQQAKLSSRKDKKEPVDLNLSRNSRIKSGISNMNKTAKERDLTPSRIINSVKNIRLSNQVVVAIGDNANMMQIQKVPVNSLL